MKKNKRKMLIIVSVILIIILMSISLMYFNSSKNNIAIKSSLKTYNAELQENEHMHFEEDSTGDKVPVPNGYVGSKVEGENEIDTGYVIYEGTEEVNNDNVAEAQKTRNQYVWIPVPDASKMYGTDENGKKWEKLYSFTTETGDGIDPITGAKPLNWSESNGVMKITDKTSYREPDVVKSYDKDSILKLNLRTYSTHTLLVQLEQEFNNMIESVEKYGGFYIGRYEIGDSSKEKVVIKKGNTDISNQTWYKMYKNCKELKNNNTNIETGMIWGSQWDRTLMWLLEGNDKTKEEICVDSSSWGNYFNSKFKYGNNSLKNTGTSIKIPTGSSEYTNVNNIYDLAGNAIEWTMESCSNRREYRGGHSQYNGDTQPANFRSVGNNPTTININIRMPSNVIYKIIKLVINFKLYNH